MSPAERRTCTEMGVREASGPGGPAVATIRGSPVSGAGAAISPGATPNAPGLAPCHPSREPLPRPWGTRADSQGRGREGGTDGVCFVEGQGLGEVAVRSPVAPPGGAVVGAGPHLPQTPPSAFKTHGRSVLTSEQNILCTKPSSLLGTHDAQAEVLPGKTSVRKVGLSPRCPEQVRRDRWRGVSVGLVWRKVGSGGGRDPDLRCCGRCFSNAGRPPQPRPARRLVRGGEDSAVGGGGCVPRRV